jgi:hypothetical protein
MFSGLSARKASTVASSTAQRAACERLNRLPGYQMARTQWSVVGVLLRERN